jgi:hypothetical protein
MASGFVGVRTVAVGSRGAQHGESEVPSETRARRRAPMTQSLALALALLGMCWSSHGGFSAVDVAAELLEFPAGT